MKRTILITIISFFLLTVFSYIATENAFSCNNKYRNCINACTKQRSRNMGKCHLYPQGSSSRKACIDLAARQAVNCRQHCKQRFCR